MRSWTCWSGIIVISALTFVRFFFFFLMIYSAGFNWLAHSPHSTEVRNSILGCGFSCVEFECPPPCSLPAWVFSDSHFNHAAIVNCWILNIWLQRRPERLFFSIFIVCPWGTWIENGVYQHPAIYFWPSRFGSGKVLWCGSELWHMRPQQKRNSSLVLHDLQFRQSSHSKLLWPVLVGHGLLWLDLLKTLHKRCFKAEGLRRGSSDKSRFFALKWHKRDMCHGNAKTTKWMEQRYLQIGIGPLQIVYTNLMHIWYPPMWVWLKCTHQLQYIQKIMLQSN